MADGATGWHFINRRDELGIFAEQSGSALHGEGTTLLILGEAGIGKSCFVEHALQEHASEAIILQASSHEDDHRPGRGLWSVAEALRRRRYLLPGDLADALPALDRIAGAADGAVPEAHGGIGALLATTVGELAQAVPVVLLAEDLHWADHLTLDFLEDVHAELVERARARRPCRLSLVVTLRPLEGSARMARLVRRLERSESTRRLELAPFLEAEVVRLVADQGRGVPSGALTRLLMQETGGNPLSVRTALRELGDAGLSREEEGVIDIVAADALPGPARTLSQRVAHQIEGVSDDVLELLQIIAVLVDDAELDRLSAVTGLSEAELGRLLDAAFRARILLGDPRVVRFAHPLYRRAVLNGLTPWQTARIHRRVADAMLQSGQRHTDGELIALGLHLAASGPVVDGARERQLCESAADISFHSGAYAESARLAERALSTVTAETPAGERALAVLRYKAARAHFRNHDQRAARPLLDAALDAAREADDVELWCDCMLVRNRLDIAFGAEATSVDANRELLDRLSGSANAVRARLWSDIAQLSFGERAFERGVDEGQQAVALAIRGQDRLAEAVGEFAVGLNRMGLLQLGAAQGCFETSHRLAELAGDAWYAQWGYGRIPMVYWMRGDPDSALLTARKAAAHGAVIKDWSERSIAAFQIVAVHALRGEFEAMEREGDEAIALLLRSQYVWSPHALYTLLGSGRAVAGDEAGAEQALARLREHSARAARWLETFICAVHGDRGRAAAIVDTGRLWHSPISSLTLTNACVLAHAAHLLGARELGASLIGPLCAVVEAGVELPSNLPTLVQRAAGLAALAAGEPEHAVALLSQALHSTTRMGASCERANIHLDLAEALHQAGRGGVREHFRQALETASALSLAPTLARGERLAGELAGDDGTVAERYAQSAAPEPAPTERTLLVTDVVGSTPMVRNLGDHRWVQVRREHDAALRACIARHDGTEFAHTGDGLAAAFDSPAAALSCGLEMHEVLARYRADSSVDLHLRAGVPHGRPIPVDGDLTGLAVNELMRVAATARADELVTTDAVRERASEAPVRFESIGPVRLRGFDEEVELFRVSARS